MAGAALHMKDFGKLIPGKISHMYDIEGLNDRWQILITYTRAMYSYTRRRQRSMHARIINLMRICDY